MKTINNLNELDKNFQRLFWESKIIAKETKISYGTSGFRYHNSCLDYLAFRTGVFINILSKLKYPQCLGIMITASHNPGEDNGLKIVNEEGNMLDLKLEKTLENFVNDFDFLTAKANLESELLQFHEISNFSQNFKGKILIGLDTRKSSIRISESVISALKEEDIEVLNFGEMTTPMLYFMVKNHNNEIKDREKFVTKEEMLAAYFDDYGKRFVRLFAHLNQGNKILKRKVVVDSANGVGYLCCKQFYEKYMQSFFEIKFINKNEVDLLNLNCGAEFVQKEHSFPKNFESENEENGLSFDGDADRLVFFRKVEGNIKIMDGDKQCALLTIGIKKVMSEFFSKIKYSLGVVVTSYSNSGLINFLKENGVESYITPTGVKYTHRKAEEFDIGIYFEANGHGTLMIKASLREKLIKEKGDKFAVDMLLFTNNVTGDAVFNFLQVELYLAYLKMDKKSFEEIFVYKKSLTYKLKVKNRLGVKTDENSGEILSPVDLEEFVKGLYEKYPIYGLRIFIRPSGTEDVLRVHMEANETVQIAEIRGVLDPFILAHLTINP